MRSTRLPWIAPLLLLVSFQTAPGPGAVPSTSPAAAAGGGNLELTLGAGCAPQWLETFGGYPGMQGEGGAVPVVEAFAHFDDGSGPAFFVGGRFHAAGGVAARGIAKWDGERWSPLGSGISGSVRALAVFDDGSGPALYAAGKFTEAGGVPADLIAKWDGQAWSGLGGGLGNGFTWELVHALRVFDDGSGPALYVAGRLNYVDGVPVNDNIARWDGQSWSQVGGGVNEAVYALEVFDDGNGPALYAGGLFSAAGGSPVAHIAKWDGLGWSPLGIGMNFKVSSLAVFDDGSQSVLVAGGAFTSAGFGTANRVASWNGQVWSPLGLGMSDINGQADVMTLIEFDAGSGPELYAGGKFTHVEGSYLQHVARWDGQSWHPVGGGIANAAQGVRVLGIFDHGAGAGPELHLGGDFHTSGPSWGRCLVKLQGSELVPFELGFHSTIRAMQVFDVGAGPELYTVTSNTTLLGSELHTVSKWNGQSWNAVGSVSGYVQTLAVHDHGSGPALHYGRNHTNESGGLTQTVALWDGQNWIPLGQGTSADVLALQSYDAGTGSGSALYAGGYFGIRRWNGQSWVEVGTGNGVSGSVRSMAVYDNGSGPKLYVAGSFTQASGVQAQNIARWNGVAWSALGSGISGLPLALVVHDDGSGPWLYVGGRFTSAGGIPSIDLARWDGIAWASFGNGVGLGPNDLIRSFATFDDGTGPSLFVSGTFEAINGVSARNIIRWDGQTWSPLGEGVGGEVAVLTAFEGAPGHPRALYVGGSFPTSPAGDSYLSRWGCPPPAEPGAAYCSGDGSANPCPCANTGAAGEGCHNSSGAGAVLSAGGSNSASADDLEFAAEHLLPAQAALLFVGTQAVQSGSGAAFGDGLRCAGGGVIRLGVRFPNAAGSAGWGPGLGAIGGWSAGDTRYFQVWYRDPVASPCGAQFNLSGGYEVSFSS